MDKPGSPTNTVNELIPKMLFIWGDQALFFGELGDFSLHRHHALQIVFGLTGPFKIQTETHILDCRAAVFSPDVLHKVEGQGAVMLLDPEAESSKQIIGSYLLDKDIAILDKDLIEPIIIELIDAMVLDFPEDYVEKLFNDIADKLSKLPDSQSSIDPRIQSVLDIINALPVKKISVGEIAKSVHLSESRLIHLFKEQVGIPIRRYLLWQRLITALNSFPNGDNLTTAAHNAGFADSAHLSRAFKEMFGIAPSEVFKDSQFVQAIFYLQK